MHNDSRDILIADRAYSCSRRVMRASEEAYDAAEDAYRAAQDAADKAYQAKSKAEAVFWHAQAAEVVLRGVLDTATKHTKRERIESAYAEIP